MRIIIRWQRNRWPARRSLAPPPVRTAVLGSLCRLPENGQLRVFPEGWSPELLAYAPESLIVPARTLGWLARAVSSGQAPLPSVSHSVVALVDGEAGRLTEEDRAMIRKAWNVPLVEQWHSDGAEPREARPCLHAACAAD
jgi:hypothetical protein